VAVWCSGSTLVFISVVALLATMGNCRFKLCLHRFVFNQPLGLTQPGCPWGRQNTYQWKPRCKHAHHATH